MPWRYGRIFRFKLSYSLSIHEGSATHKHGKKKGNISGTNQLLRANCANSNLDHRINIRGAQGSEREICKSMIIKSKSGRLIVKLPKPPCPLDVDPVAQIRVCTVCTKRLVCTWYVPKKKKNIFQNLIYGTFHFQNWLPFKRCDAYMTGTNNFLITAL